MDVGEALGGAVVGDQEAAGQARQQALRGLGETVGQAEGVAEAADDAGVARKIGGVRRCGACFGMDQERGAAVGFGAHEFDAAFGFAPAVDDDVFEFFVQECFAGFFPGGVGYFDEVGEDAGGFEIVRLAALDLGEETLYGFGGIGAVRKDFFERIPAGFLFREDGAELFELLAHFERSGAALLHFLVDAAAVVGQGFEFQLPRGELGGELGLYFFQAGEVAGGSVFFFVGAGGVAFDGGQVFVDLGELIAEAGGFAEQAEDLLAGGFDGLFRDGGDRLGGRRALRFWRACISREAPGLPVRLRLRLWSALRVRPVRARGGLPVPGFRLRRRRGVRRWSRFAWLAVPGGRGCARIRD